MHSSYHLYSSRSSKNFNHTGEGSTFPFTLSILRKFSKIPYYSLANFQKFLITPYAKKKTNFWQRSVYSEKFSQMTNFQKNYENHISFLENFIQKRSMIAFLQEMTISRLPRNRNYRNSRRSFSQVFEKFSCTLLYRKNHSSISRKFQSKKFVDRIPTRKSNWQTSQNKNYRKSLWYFFTGFSQFHMQHFAYWYPHKTAQIERSLISCDRVQNTFLFSPKKCVKCT